MKSMSLNIDLVISGNVTCNWNTSKDADDVKNERKNVNLI
jgi:hypothetical protein